MRREDIADVLWQYFLMESDKHDNNSWQSFLKKAREHKPKRSQISIAVQLALTAFPLKGGHGADRARTG